MDLAMIGFGRMGSGLTGRLAQAGHRVVVVDPAASAEAVAARGGEGPHALDELPGLLTGPRVAWVMVPAGDPTQAVVDRLMGLLEPGDVIVDGGNSNFRDSQRRAAAAAERGLRFLDVGVSGGVWGLTEGFGLMVGGEPEAYALLEPALRVLAPPGGGLVHAGASGAGHFTKMVHNGIEYGLMQAYAEGFEILQASEFDLDLAAVADAWRQGTVIRSWLLDLTARALAHDPGLEGIRGYVEDSGEGRWTVAQAIDTDVPAPIITLSLLERFRSRQDESFTAKVVAALRREFGGHSVRSS
ncbi:MAG TPA: decarboxylating 6-phosphogluconate dehydrogenase [Miltoncostaeaceae bacterium]|nr:decarboxylating 6-phosphogluconate dehydrogenase [Miltoncostaeaceae bacterium]